MGSLLGTLIPFMKAPPHDLSTFIRPHFLIPLSLGVRISLYEFLKERHNSQTTALDLHTSYLLEFFFFFFDQAPPKMGNSLPNKKTILATLRSSNS